MVLQFALIGVKALANPVKIDLATDSIYKG
jgi:hypothetical protein